MLRDLLDGAGTDMPADLVVLELMAAVLGIPSTAFLEAGVDDSSETSRSDD